MNLLKAFGIDPVEEALKLLLANSPRHRAWAKRLWRGRRDLHQVAAVVAEALAYYDDIELPAGSAADQIIGALIAHAYEPHARVALTRTLQRPPTDAELACARAGVQGMVEGILPRCE